MYFLRFITIIVLLLFATKNQAQNSIDIQHIKNQLKYLGSDELQGRGTGTAGIEKAADFIQSQLNLYNLRPFGSDSGFVQYIPMHGSIPKETSQLTLYYKDTRKKLELRKDYLLCHCGDYTFTPNPVPLVFAGYGIIAPEFDYNDYSSVEVKDKIVIFLPGEPFSQDPDFFDGKKNTIYSYPESKQRIAISRGARGSIMLPGIDEMSDKNWEQKIKEYSFEDISLGYTVSRKLNILVQPQVAMKLFESEQYSLSQIYEQEKKGILSGFDLKKQVSFSGEFRKRDFQSKNLIALSKGKDSGLQDTYLIVSAHYDHLGIGPPVNQDSVYNGVLDNAIGVSILLELSRLFAKMENKTKRSLIFLFLTGEEKGLLGSRYYTRHPRVPLYKSVLNLNIDGIAAIDEFKEIVAVGSKYSNIMKFIKPVLTQHNMHISDYSEEFYNESESITKSDQYSFALAGVPSVMILEGLKYKNIPAEFGLQRLIIWKNNIYHSPFDDLKQPINWDAVQQYANLMFDIIKYTANSDQDVQWHPGTPFINERLRTIAEKR